jgi:hypothetical protein
LRRSEKQKVRRKEAGRLGGWKAKMLGVLGCASSSFFLWPFTLSLKPNT